MRGCNRSAFLPPIPIIQSPSVELHLLCQPGPPPDAPVSRKSTCSSRRQIPSLPHDRIVVLLELMHVVHSLSALQVCSEESTPPPSPRSKSCDKREVFSFDRLLFTLTYHLGKLSLESCKVLLRELEVFQASFYYHHWVRGWKKKKRKCRFFLSKGGHTAFFFLNPWVSGSVPPPFSFF